MLRGNTQINRPLFRVGLAPLLYNIHTTQVVAIASPTFNYTAIDKAKAKLKQSATERFPDTIGKNMKAGLPPKVYRSTSYEC